MEELDVDRLEAQVQRVYQDVAEEPTEDFHFETGRELAERLGYDPADLDGIPQAAMDSFAGVGYHFDFAELEPGDRVLDLGCGAGTDCFVASQHVGEAGEVVGLDFTESQLEKGRTLATEAGVSNVALENGHIEELPFADETFDAVVSNGVINLSAAKDQVFAEAARVLVPGGRLAISDIISEEHLPDRIKSNEDLWAACIGGAMQVDQYTETVEDAGFTATTMRENDDYQFISDQAANACQQYGVKSISLRATRSE